MKVCTPTRLSPHGASVDSAGTVTTLIRYGT